MHPFLRVQKCTFIVKKHVYIDIIYIIYIYKYIIYIECIFLSSRLNGPKIKCICCCKGEQLPNSLSQSKRLFIVRSQVLCFQRVCIFLRVRRTSRMTSHDISKKYIYIHKLLRSEHLRSRHPLCRKDNEIKLEACKLWNIMRSIIISITRLCLDERLQHLLNFASRWVAHGRMRKGVRSWPAKGTCCRCHSLRWITSHFGDVYCNPRMSQWKLVSLLRASSAAPRKPHAALRTVWDGVPVSMLSL